MFYLAVEPYARRFWPDALLAWTRLLSGRLRDPRVGRELLIGLSFGALSLLVVEIPKLFSIALGWRMPPFPFGNALWVLVGVPPLVSLWLNTMIAALQSALAIAMIFLLLRLLLRRPRRALVAGVLVLLVAMNGGAAISGTWTDTFNVVAFTALITLVIHRFGLLAAATMLLVDNIVADVPLTTDLSAWWSTPTTLSLALMIGLLCYAYRCARAGQPLFGRCSVSEGARPATRDTSKNTLLLLPTSIEHQSGNTRSKLPPKIFALTSAPAPISSSVADCCS